MVDRRNAYHPRARSQAQPQLTIFQVNVNRSPTAHVLALQLAFDKKADVLLLQEPWIGTTPEPHAKTITKRHTAYHLLSPLPDWTTRPRVLSYSRRDRRGLRCDIAAFGTPHPDISALDVSLPGFPSTRVINLYNAPVGSARAGEAVDTIRSLLDISSPSRFLLAGDFNLHHESWEPLRSTQRSSAQARGWVEWCELNGIALVSEIGTPTHSAGGVLDLVWASPALLRSQSIAAFPDCDLATPSDHSTVRISFAGGTGAVYGTPGPLKMSTFDPEMFAQTLRGSIHPALEAATRAWIAPAYSPDRKDTLDELAQSLTAGLHTALEAATKRSTGRARGQPWWNDNCRTATAQWRQQKRHHVRALAAGLPGEREEASLSHAHKALAKAVGAAKREFFDRVIREATDNRDFYKMTKWASRTVQSKSPTLVPESGPPATTTEEKIHLLRQVHLPQDRTAEDIPPPPLSPSIGPKWDAISRAEIENALLHSRNSAPGQDEIPPAAIRAAWPLIEEPVYALYNLCLQEGWHPTPFRSALLCVIEKPSTTSSRPRSHPRAYRLIALLSVLGKGLERIIARRLAFTAVTAKIIPSRYFGSLPLRSAEDLARLVVDDIEEAFNAKKCHSALTFDVQGAFDAVLPNRLLGRLTSQGWPQHVVCWVSSFLTDRSAAVRLDGTVSASSPAPGSLPQGSPISPVLFQLFAAPIFSINRTKGARHRYGYADDGCLGATAKTPSENGVILQQELQAIYDWSLREHLPLDFAKLRLMHFTRSTKADNPAITISTANGPLTIPAISTCGTLTYLGVRLDRKLSFRPHVSHVTSKARKAASALRMLSGCFRGASPALLRRAVTACIIPVMTYGSTIWWPFKDGPVRRAIGLVKKMDVVQNIALRSALPVFRTTPIPLLQCAAGIPPIALTLDDLNRRFAIRLSRLDPDHPLKKRIRFRRSSEHTATSLCLFHTLLPAELEPSNPLAQPPWRAPLSPAACPSRTGNRSEQANHFLQWQTTTSPRDLWVYSDGSKLADGRSGAGWTVQILGREVASGSAPLGVHQEVFDAEAYALRRGLEAASAVSCAPHAAALYASLDNQSVVSSVYGGSISSSQSNILAAQTAIATWKDRHRPSAYAQLPTDPAAVVWLPGHAGIRGNVRADQLAGAAAALPPASHPTGMSAAGARRWARDELASSFTQYWDAQPTALRALAPSPKPRTPVELHLPRATVFRLLAARSGHGDFAEYHERFHHEDATLDCSCGNRKARLHFAECPLTRRKDLLFPRIKDGDTRRPLTPTEVVTTPAGAQAFQNWLSATQYFHSSFANVARAAR